MKLKSFIYPDFSELKRTGQYAIKETELVNLVANIGADFRPVFSVILKNPIRHKDFPFTPEGYEEVKAEFEFQLSHAIKDIVQKYMEEDLI